MSFWAFIPKLPTILKVIIGAAGLFYLVDAAIYQHFYETLRTTPETVGFDRTAIASRALGLAVFVLVPALVLAFAAWLISWIVRRGRDEPRTDAVTELAAKVSPRGTLAVARVLTVLAMIVSLAAQVAGIYHTRHHHHATVTYRGAAGVRDVGITLTPWRLPLLHLPVIDTPAQKAWVEWLGSSAPPSLVQCPWVIYLGQGSSSAVFVLPGQTVTLPASDVIVHVGQVNPGSTSTPEGCWK